MKINSSVVLQLNIIETELLNQQYTRTIAKIIASELSLQEINELIEKLVNNDILLIKNKHSEYTKQIL